MKAQRSAGGVALCHPPSTRLYLPLLRSHHLTCTSAQMTSIPASAADPALLSPGWDLVNSLPARDPEEYEEDEVRLRLSAAPPEPSARLTSNLAKVSYLVLDAGNHLRASELSNLDAVQISVCPLSLCLSSEFDD